MTTAKTGPARAQGARRAGRRSGGYPSDLTDAQWQVIVVHLPAEMPGRRGRLRVWPLRRIVEAILYLDRAGCAWWYLPRRPLALLDSLPAHGDVVEIRLGPRPAYVVCHPGLARQVLTDFRLFDRTGLVYARVRTAMGNDLASATHQDHRRQWLIMQPAFRREHLRGYVAVMCQEIAATMEAWHDGDRVDLVDEMFALTTTIALRALFSPTSTPPERLEHKLVPHQAT